MLYSNLKRELLDMFHADQKVLEREVGKMTAKLSATLRTTRLGDRPLQPGEEPALVRRTGAGQLGKGLFANRDFEIGEFITTFPIDCTLYKDDDGRTKVCYAADVDMAALAKDGDGHAVLANRKFAHLVSDTGMPLSMAMPEVARAGSDDSPFYWGHWADDAASLDPRASNAKLAAKRYGDESFAAANATHIIVADGIFVWTVATRPIAKGDEIFVSHGVNWWRSYNAMQAVGRGADFAHAGSSSTDVDDETAVNNGGAADAV